MIYFDRNKNKKPTGSKKGRHLTQEQKDKAVKSGKGTFALIYQCKKIADAKVKN